MTVSQCLHRYAMCLTTFPLKWISSTSESSRYALHSGHLPNLTIEESSTSCVINGIQEQTWIYTKVKKCMNVRFFLDLFN